MAVTPHGLSLGDDDSKLVKAFHQGIQQALVYVERTCLKSGRTIAGTGTVIGYQGNPTDGWLPYIATAGHVIRSDKGHESKFRLSRYSFADPAHPTQRIAEFESGVPSPRSPGATYYSGPARELIDIGFIRGPKECTDGNTFFELNGIREPIAGTAPIESDWNWAAEGTRVAWAGFPGIATEIAERPQPCYFEGCVSALIIRDEYQLYLLDGHNTFGVSGGPVWSISHTTRSPRIIGVISSYHSRADLPGFVHAVPIQPLRVFLEKFYGAKFRPLG